MAEVTLAGVSKYYGDVLAVDTLDLTIADREFLILLGPSGCGKSTTLRMIAGLEEVTTGRIAIGGRDVTHVPAGRRDVAMVFQNYALYPHMSVADNLAFGLKMRGTPKAEIAARIREAAGILELTDLLARRPAQLSGGQRQRVALGRAIVRHPQVFLMDEPLSNLDAQLRTQTRTELAKLHRRLGATIVYVTHDQVEALSLGTRVVVLDRGVIQQIAPPRELYDAPANLMVAQFIGSPHMNFLAAELIEREGRSYGRTAGVEIPLPPIAAPRLAGRDLVIGLRPEHLRLDPAPPASPDGHLAGVIDLVTPIGGDVIVDVASDAGELIVRAGFECDLPPGTRVTLHPQRVHVFDRATGRAIAAG